MSKPLIIRQGDAVEQEIFSKTLFGFWVYLMSDCILFSTLFATFIVLHQSTAGAPPLGSLFSLPFVLTETLVLLVSSFTSGLALLAAERNQKNKILGWFFVTFLLGVTFLAMELTEFTDFVHHGHSWRKSAALSSFFTLVGTHGLHIFTGLVWMIILLVPVWRHGLTPVSYKRLMCLRLFWHFLDVVWIFIFTIVYLMEVVK